jgi:hypothetical protein
MPVDCLSCISIMHRISITLDAQPQVDAPPSGWQFHRL